jgi:hypothetical protein
MPSTYTLNNGIELIGTGEQSGTWGDTTNTNLGLLDAALDGQVTITLAAAGSSGSPNALPITDGTTSNGRNRMVVFADGGDLGATAYVQLTPNDAEKIIYIRNSLSGSRSVILFQGTYNASNDYEVPAGTTAVVYFDGAGAGAVAANVFNNAYFDGLRLGSVSVTAILDEDNMASDSATALATQQSIKAYVDSQVGTVDTLAEILAIGNTTGATDIAVDSAQKVQFRDAAIYINSSVDGQLDIVADTEIQIAATTVDVNGALDVSGTALVTGVLTTTAATVSNGGGQFNGAINVGVDDTGYDVKFFGATTGKSLLWDESADSLIVTGTTTLVGTTNLDAVDIDGATQIDATVTVGVDDTGYDVKFFGATAGAYMLWDESADDLILGGAGGLVVAGNVDFNGDLDVDGTTNLDVVDIDGTLNVAGVSTFTAAINQTTESPSINLTDSSSSRTLSVNVDDNNSFLRASGPMLLQTGGANTAITINASQNSTFAGTVTATGTSVFASLDISGDIDVDGTTNLDVVDIDGAVDMASTLQVTGAANFSDRIGSKYVYPTDPTSQTGEVTNYFWKMGRMTLAGPAAAEIKLYGLTGYGQGDQIAGTNIIQLRGSNSATVLDGCFHTIGDPGIGIQEMRYVPIGSSVFDLYVKLGPFFSLSTTVVSGGTWVPEWTDTGSGSNPASSVDIPPQYALVLGSTLPMHANLTEVAFNDYSNDVNFRVESDGNTHMLFVDAGQNAVAIGNATASYAFHINENRAGNYVFGVTNDGNNVDRYGMIMRLGTDDGSSTSTYIAFDDGDGSGVGAITGSGGTITYATFTAVHPAILPDADNENGYAYGTLLDTTEITYSKRKNGQETERGIRYKVVKSASANSRAVLGAYAGKDPKYDNEHLVNVLGDGHILCNNSGGNIAVGDGVCTSATVGIGQKATASPSMIIGIAQEAVTFANNTETKLVAVQYGLQQFTPWS